METKQYSANSGINFAQQSQILRDSYDNQIFFNVYSSKLGAYK